MIADPKKKTADHKRDRTCPHDLEIRDRHDDGERERCDEKNEILFERVLRDACVDFHRSVFCVAQGIDGVAQEAFVADSYKHEEERDHGDDIREKCVGNACADDVGDIGCAQKVREERDENDHTNDAARCADGHRLLFLLHR